jgi:SPP1 family predicted phage head-tail adaptor
MAYNKKIELQRLVGDGDGSQLPSYEPIGTFWASVNCIGGREYYAAVQYQAENDMIFKVRYCSKLADIKPITTRILYNNKIYDIKHVDDYMEQHRELVIRALESGA